jgi:hypothetical protein
MRISVPGRARALRVPLPRVVNGQQRSLMSPVAEYPQVSLVQLRTLIIARSSKLGMRVRYACGPLRSFLLLAGSLDASGGAREALGVSRVPGLVYREALGNPRPESSDHVGGTVQPQGAQ